MEDYEAQEIEFWAKLEEEGMSRSSMLRRSAAAAIGLTVVGGASTALGATRARLAGPPTKETVAGLPALIKAAKKEGHLNTIALPPDWANYKEALAAFPKKYGIGITNDNPDGSSAQENEAIRSLKSDSRAPDVVDVGVSFAISGANEGLYAKYFNTNYKTIPRALKDTRASGWVTTGAPSPLATTRRSSRIRRRRSRIC
jgi:putative spermidine/putrescine transport system substrate-binding protein